ncbi:MAG: tetratricopeptide repeat protein [Actinobacteria bacterium]|nr:tetratricopeptide repeat protein [Actinomycetota bacterium]
MPKKNFLKLAGLAVLIFFLISFFALGTSSCAAIKKSSQSGTESALTAAETGKDIPDSSSESVQESTNIDSAASSNPSDTTVSDNSSESSDNSANSDENNTNQEDSSGTDSTDTGTSASAADITGQRELFSEGIQKFEDGDYLAAEYYFNKIKDTYKMLADHINYYLAKSLLMQGKYDLSAKNYSRIKNIYPDSIFYEKANLEYADLLYVQQKYSEAETNYESFVKNFPKSELLPYALFQLAICQEKNSKFESAFENYKKIWLNFPENEFADDAINNITSLSDRNLIGPFKPSNEQLYSRGAIFFDLYQYENAIGEFNKIIEAGKNSSLSSALYSKTLFKLGMSYFNLRDYSKSTELLISCYEKFPSESYADDSLYFLGRAFTSLSQEDNSISYYQKVLSKFPQGNFADDSLYRIGRIYFLRGDLESAAANYEEIINNYPGGDKIPDAYWELGWIQFKSGDYNSAKTTFQGMKVKFKGTSIGEEAMFWEARSLQKLGENDAAANIYKEIIDSKTYSYYAFASQRSLKSMSMEYGIPKIDNTVYPYNPKINELLPEIYKDTDNNNSGSGSGQDGKFTHIDKAKELLNLEFYISATKEIEAGSGELEQNNLSILEISTLYLEAKDYLNSQKLIAKYFSKLKSNLDKPYKDYIYYLLYPYGFKEYIDKYSKQFNIDPLFVLAVIREESRFQPDAGSYAGALGLMQIIPKTGKGIASQLGIAKFDNQMLLDPELSIKMGAYYLSRQLESFNQNKYYAAGAYNGGPGSMNKWISSWGDKDIEEFIEYVSYDETRNYIKKVMGSYFFYQMLYP